MSMEIPMGGQPSEEIQSDRDKLNKKVEKFTKAVSVAMGVGGVVLGAVGLERPVDLHEANKVAGGDKAVTLNVNLPKKEIVPPTPTGKPVSMKQEQKVVTIDYTQKLKPKTIDLEQNIKVKDIDLSTPVKTMRPPEGPFLGQQ